MKLQSKIGTQRQTLRFPLTVGSAAAVVGVSAATLRLYEQEGIVKPDRDSEGRRLFLPEDIAVIRAHRAALGRK